MWKWKKKEEKKDEKEEKKGNLLKELCGDDAELYAFLGHNLLINPLDGISEKSLDILTEEAEKSGNYRPALDKAFLECAQKPGEREQYIKVIQNLASKTLYTTEQEKEKAEKEGLTDKVTSLERIIEEQKFMSERTEDIINVASKFYNERLIELGEAERREKRRGERQQAEGEEWRTRALEKAEREASKKERRKMGREERREAEEQDKREELAAEERREAREEARQEAEREDQRIAEMEETEREARKKERRGN